MVTLTACKQFTYALLDERAPSAKKFRHDEALAELTKRYFASRGPATVQDFVWWSGLTVKDAKAGIATLSRGFIHENIHGHDYIFPPTNPISNNKLQTTFLMPDYDEYGISYKNRNAIYNPSNIKGERLDGNTVFNHMIIIDGLIAGTWQKRTDKNGVTVQTYLYKILGKAKHKLLLNAKKKYLTFISAD